MKYEIDVNKSPYTERKYFHSVAVYDPITPDDVELINNVLGVLDFNTFVLSTVYPEELKSYGIDDEYYHQFLFWSDRDLSGVITEVLKLIIGLTP